MGWYKGSVLKDYVSELDSFLKEFDRRSDASSSARKAEEARAALIEKLREDPDFSPPTTTKVWDDF
jgi:hypothetical protein